MLRIMYCVYFLVHTVLISRTYKGIGKHEVRKINTTMELLNEVNFTSKDFFQQ